MKKDSIQWSKNSKSLLTLKAIPFLTAIDVFIAYKYHINTKMNYTGIISSKRLPLQFHHEIKKSTASVINPQNYRLMYFRFLSATCLEYCYTEKSHDFIHSVPSESIVHTNMFLLCPQNPLYYHRIPFSEVKLKSLLLRSQTRWYLSAFMELFVFW